MAINIGLENLSEKKVSSSPELASTRLQVTDALSESVRVYIRNLRLEYSVEDYLLLSHGFEEAVEKLACFRDDKKDVKISILSRLYKSLINGKFKFFFIPVVNLIKKHVSTEVKDTIKQGGRSETLVELSRPFFDKVVEKLDKEQGKYVFLRKYENLPHSMIGGDVDLYTTIEPGRIREIMSQCLFECVDQEQGDELAHIHCYWNDQHYDFSYRIVYNQNLAGETKSQLDNMLVRNVVRKDGVNHLDEPSEMFHLIDSCLNKYKTHIPRYYEVKTKILKKKMDSDMEKLLFEFFDLLPDEEHDKYAKFYKSIN